MIYIKNWLLNLFTIYKSIVNSFQVWNYRVQLTINYFCIFGNITYVLNDSKLNLKLAIKAGISYLVRYERQYQYYIYDLVYHAIFIQRDKILTNLQLG